jgi:chemotaxis protein methyltransferase CheR
MIPHVFRALRDLAYEQAGIDIGDEKEPLVAARVGKRMRALGLGTEREYLDKLQADTTGGELVQFLDAISTNFTSFFRESEHFDQLASAIKSWHDQGQTRFRIWSAASSSGEEPYTIAIVLSELFRQAAVDFRILATDISTKVLGMAQQGRYAARQVQPVRKDLLERYFVRDGADRTGEATYEVVPSLKPHIAYRRLNLSRPPFPMSGPFDVIFCRNVMIYFDARVRQALVSEMERYLRPGGYLMVGHAETLSGLDTGLTLVTPSTYRRAGGDA